MFRPEQESLALEMRYMTSERKNKDSLVDVMGQDSAFGCASLVLAGSKERPTLESPRPSMVHRNTPS